MSIVASNPFRGKVPKTVRLPNTPLTGVVAQIQFPEILSIAKPDFVADFQEKIRGDYPNNQQEQGLVLQVSPEGARRMTSPNWRFFDTDLEWRVSLTTSFLALETRAYQTRSDFTARLGKIAKALEETISPRIMTRLGVRYVDRVYGDVLDRLEDLVRPEISGLAKRDYREHVVRTMNEALSKSEEGMVLLRWGYMPEKNTHDAGMMPPIAVDSWFLDIDVYTEFQPPKPFDAAGIEKRAKKLATRAYGVFRWAVNEEFIRAHGGNI